MFDKKVKMIWHETIRNDRRAVLLIIPPHQPQKVLVIFFVEENLSLPRAAVVDMIILPLRKDVTAIWHGYLSKRPAGLTERLSRLAQNLRDGVARASLLVSGVWDQLTQYKPFQF